MSYLFSPDNWEWLWTGNNFRFILEGFLINLEIAVISMIFALIVGLMLALGRLSRFKPLSFVAGVYGMNFDTKLPGNMPELNIPYAYVGVLALMATITAVQIGFFWKRGWLGSDGAGRVEPKTKPMSSAASKASSRPTHNEP